MKRGSQDDYHAEDCLVLSKHRTSHPSGNVGEILSEASVPVLSGTDGFCKDMGYAASTPCLGARPALGPRSAVIMSFCPKVSCICRTDEIDLDTVMPLLLGLSSCSCICFNAAESEVFVTVFEPLPKLKRQRTTVTCFFCV
jgi:hypothetical protein